MPPAFLALAFISLFVGGGYAPLGYTYLSLFTGVFFTLVGITWWLFTAGEEKKGARSIVIGTWVASTPLLYIVVMAVRELILRN